MARTTGRSGFKMRSGNSPLRQDESAGEVQKKTLGSEISRFFSDLHTGLQTGAKKHQDWKARVSEQNREKQIARNKGTKYEGMTHFEKMNAKRAEARIPKWKREHDARKAAEAAKAAEVKQTDVSTIPLSDDDRYLATKIRKVKGYTFSGKKGDKYKYRSVPGEFDYKTSYEFQRDPSDPKYKGPDVWETSKTEAGGKAIHDLWIGNEKRDVEITPIQKKSPARRYKKKGGTMASYPSMKRIKKQINK